jgi:hypothetical protein
MPSAAQSTAPRTTRLTRCRTALSAQLQLKLSQARQDAGHHSARSVRGVDALAKRPQHNAALAEVADGGHYLGGVAAQAVDTDNDDGVALARVVEQCGKAGTLLTGRGARQLVRVDASWVNACNRQRIDLLVK